MTPFAFLKLPRGHNPEDLYTLSCPLHGKQTSWVRSLLQPAYHLQTQQIAVFAGVRLSERDFGGRCKTRRPEEDPKVRR